MSEKIEPIAWVIPGTDNATDKGFLDAMAWREGEFTEPLFSASSIYSVQKRNNDLRDMLLRAQSLVPGLYVNWHAHAKKLLTEG